MGVGVTVGLGVVVVCLNLVYVALNPLEVKWWLDLNRTTIVLLLDSNGFGKFCPQNLPVIDRVLVSDIKNNTETYNMCL